MDEILNGDLQQWEWVDATTVDLTMFFWLLGGCYLLILVAVVIRAIMKRRTISLSNPKPFISKKQLDKRPRRRALYK